MIRERIQSGGRPAGVRNVIPNPPPGWHGDEKEASERGVSIPTLRRQAAAGIGPRPVKHGRHAFYRDGAFAEYLEQRVHDESVTGVPH